MRSGWTVGCAALLLVAGCGVSGRASKSAEPSTTPTATAAVRTDDEGLIAFEKGTFDKDVRLVFYDPVTTKVTAVPGGEFGYYARFSRDGSMLAWARMRDADVGTDALMVHDLRTGKTRKVANDGGCPAFAPDGGSIVSVGERIHLDTGKVEQLPGPKHGCRVEMEDGRFLYTAGDEKLEVLDGARATTIYEAPGCRIDTASLSPDNSEVAFVRSCKATNTAALMVVRVDGSDARTVVEGNAYGTGWSPDGRSLVTAHANPGDKGLALWTLGVDGAPSTFEQIQPGPVNTPTWGPTAPSD